MDALFLSNFQLERKRECATAEYLWRTTVNEVLMVTDISNFQYTEYDADFLHWLEAGVLIAVLEYIFNEDNYNVIARFLSYNF